MNDSSVASSVAVMKIKYLETFGAKCPDCGASLYRRKAFNKKGEKIPGACMTPGCGYKEPLKNAERRTLSGQDLTVRAYANDAYSNIQSTSVVSTLTVFNNKFENYITKLAQERQALNYAKGIVKKMAGGETVHALMIGPVGSGKTHLATGIMYSYMKKKDYLIEYVEQIGNDKVKRTRSIKAVFLDFPELMSQLQLGISNKDVRKRVDAGVEATKHSDLVIVDDLGAERESDFTLSVIDTILRATENRNLIITTNLNGSNLSSKYGERAFSRMKMHGVGNSFSFNGITDHRG